MKKQLYTFLIIFLIFFSCSSPSIDGEEINNDTPTAVDDYTSTSQNTAVNINVLANDNFGNDGSNKASILLL
jgi:hypothetical protein